MTPIVLGVALAALALLVAGALVVRRRRMLGLVLVGLGVLGLVAGDLVPRELATREVATDCLTASVAPAVSPLAWQAVTGGVLLDAHVAPRQVETMVSDRLAGTPFAGADVRLVPDAVEVDGRVDSPFGALDVTADLRPTVSDDRLTWDLGTLRVGGRPVPAALLDRFGGGALAGARGSGCGTGGLGRGAVRSASVDSSGLVLRVAI